LLNLANDSDARSVLLTWHRSSRLKEVEERS